MASSGSSLTQWRFLAGLRDYLYRASPALGAVPKDIQKAISQVETLDKVECTGNDNQKSESKSDTVVKVDGQ